jgi:hypothetical protein
MQDVLWSWYSVEPVALVLAELCPEVEVDPFSQINEIRPTSR